MGAISGFSVEMAAFLSQGYDVVIPNYRGSFSYGREFLHELEGFVGIKDVDDCQDSVVRAKDIVKPSLIIAYGGSHGGFLTGWLLGHPEYRSTYAGGVLWNPAVDLVSSNLTSDIPDWAINVAIGPVDDPVEKFAPSIHFLKRAYAQSAISVVRNVKAPALVLLGSNDRRVVPCAGLRWAQAVQEMGGDVEVHWYPDQGHAIPGPEYYETAIVTVGMWIKQKFT
jgi:acylaminoacyl-peptidase